MRAVWLGTFALLSLHVVNAVYICLSFYLAVPIALVVIVSGTQSPSLERPTFPSLHRQILREHPDTLTSMNVEKLSSASNDVAHLVVASSNIPLGLWKRLLVREEGRRNHRIRERQTMVIECENQTSRGA